MPIATIVDANGDAVDLSKVITMISDLHVVNDNDEEFWFLSMHQYLYEDISFRQTYYDKDCQKITSPVMMNNYRVVIDEEDFYVPVCFAVIENKLRPTWQQDYKTWERKKADQPKDVIKEYKNITGIDLKKRLQDEHDAYELYKEELKKRKKKTKIPYRVEQDSADEQTY